MPEQVDDATTYTLRHSHASALHYCGFTVPAAAKRRGTVAACTFPRTPT